MAPDESHFTARMTLSAEEDDDDDDNDDGGDEAGFYDLNRPHHRWIDPGLAVIPRPSLKR